jgi:energy-coupling factor transport system ATP-binding protein
VIYLAYIKAVDLTFGYDKEKQVLKNINIELLRGQFAAITGPNGCGKTTLGKLLMGILKPQSGKIFIQDKDIAQMNLGQTGSKIGYLFQNPAMQIFAPTVYEELSFIMNLKGYEKDIIEEEVQCILEMLHLKEKKYSSTYNLSYGEKQRLAIGAILLSGPGYLILDEPTTGLDALRREILFNILNDLLNKDIGVAIISHDMKFIERFSGRLFKINEGQIIETGIK